MTVVVGTAGHIDHGKTSLLRALTGIDADRLPEERRRGMTIDVGYAHLALPDGTELDFVDVPGHDRLIGNMLVGAGEIDAVLLVVAADDGPRAQTLEHLELLDGLGIRDGVAVVTKVDGLAPGDPRRVDVRAAVSDLLARTSLAGSPVLLASSATGEGIDDIRAALVRVRDAALVRQAASRGPLRLSVDRVFGVRGRGTVVTGTLAGGPMRIGRSVRVEPGGGTARIRGIEVHGSPVEETPTGGRVAANVAGLAPEAIHRGAVLTDGPGIVASSAVLAALRRPVRLGSGEAAWPIASGTTLRLHIGTDQVDARVRRSRHETLAEASDLDLVRLVLDRPVALAVGDRFVLRHPSPGSTAAGGLVVDTSPVAGISRRRASAERLGALVASVGGASGGRVDGAGAADGVGPVTALVDLHGVLTSRRAADMAAGLGLPPPDRPPGTRVLAGHLLAEDVAVALDDAALAAVGGPAGRPALERPGAAGLSGAASLPGALDLPGATGLPLVELRRALAASLRRVATVARSDAAAIAAATIDALVAAGRLRREGDLVRDPAARPGRPPELTAAMDRLELALSVASPPQLSVAAREAGCPPEGVRALESAGRLVRLEDDLAWAFATYRDLAALALRMADPGPLSPAAFRDATGSSRKYVLAILEDLDRRGLLQRTPDGHVLGPRAPRPAAR